MGGPPQDLIMACQVPRCLFGSQRLQTLHIVEQLFVIHRLTDPLTHLIGEILPVAVREEGFLFARRICRLQTPQELAR